VTDRPSTSATVFGESRQAFGWLASSWAGSLIAVLVWSWIVLRHHLLDLHPSAWVSAGSTALILGLGVINVWGHWVSSEARPLLKEATRHRRLAWWERDRFACEHAAERLGWAPRPVVWVTRALMGLAGIATIVAVAVLISGWW
jgi:hypothetical protein